MVFSSIEFIFRFLPILLVVYYAFVPKWRNVALFIGSILFYAFGEPLYVFVMLISIAINYRISLHLKGNRKLLIFAMTYNFGLLFVFKYLGFVIRNINFIASGELIPNIELFLPLGISFYTFQIASYMIDVYRGTYEASKQWLHFATYISMFPQLVAGPIVQFPEVAGKLQKRTISFDEIETGVAQFVIGLSYKVLIANKIASLWNSVLTIGPKGVDTATAWLGAWGYSMQIYFDFFGYSLMAIGLGHMLGFHLPENFKNPYCVTSMTEFWRTWHITLGRWFREYVYIPLGGSRNGTVRMIKSMLIVWLLTGIWHGADWNFIIWGLGLGVILIIERFFLKKYLDKYHFLGHVYMLLLIPISWTVFNISDLGTLGLYLMRMLHLPIAGDVAVHGTDKLFSLLQTYWWLLAIAIFCCTKYPMQWFEKYKEKLIVKVILFGLFWFSVYQLSQGQNNPFLYFRF